MILDRTGCRLPIDEVAGGAIAGGADVIQLREKALAEDELKDLAELVIAAAGDSRRVAINGNLALALKLGTDVHFPESVSEPVTWPSPERLVSRAIHVPVHPERLGPADYYILGNVFETGSKAGLPGIGLRAVQDICRALAVPVVAIGGIEPSNVGSVLEAGAHGVAVRSFIIGADDPEAATRLVKAEVVRWTR